MSLQRRWFERELSPALWPLFPIFCLFVVLLALRRLAYRLGVLRSERLPVPVCVVGNLIVGGAGKTPLVLGLAKALQDHGWRPGILSRGYGTQATHARPVTTESRAVDVGDEPLLLARRSGVPVWVGADRVAAGRGMLAAHPEVNLLLTDDGLQHVRLARDAEIVVFDRRGAGNGWRLPLGPLREPLTRLKTVTAVVSNGTLPPDLILPAGLPVFAMRLQAAPCYRLDDPAQLIETNALHGRLVHAVAGIGDPQRFFGTLEALGLAFTPHAFPDHHPYTAQDLDFGPDAVLLMTEKDAVKCRELNLAETWVLPVTAELPAELIATLLEKIDGR